MIERDEGRLTILHIIGSARSLQATVPARPTPTPVVNLHPRIPANAMGKPSTSENETQISAGASCPTPPPSVAAPWATLVRVVGSMTVACPVVVLAMMRRLRRRWRIWDSGRRGRDAGRRESETEGCTGSA